MDQGTIPMTLREQCEQFLDRFMRQIDWAGFYQPLTKQIALEKVEAFARQQQAVGLREAATEGSKVIAAYADGVPASQLAKWCEQRARDLEGG